MGVRSGAELLESLEPGEDSYLPHAPSAQDRRRARLRTQRRGGNVRSGASALMSGQTIEELLAECSDPLTEDEYQRRRADLERRFAEQHGLSTWEEIRTAIRTHAIEESILVEEWIELRAFEEAIERSRR